MFNRVQKTLVVTFLITGSLSTNVIANAQGPGGNGGQQPNGPGGNGGQKPNGPAGGNGGQKPNGPGGIGKP